MTKLFKKTGFMTSAGYVHYDCGADRRFVARFKYNRANAGPFVTFLCKNFEVEEYFTLLEAGSTPVAILETKGYVSPSAKKLCKKLGFPLTLEGYKDAIHFIASEQAEKFSGSEFHV